MHNPFDDGNHSYEMTTYSDHEIVQIVESEIISGLKVYKAPLFRCPNCTLIQSDLTHDCLRKCECGIQYKRLGNALFFRKKDSGKRKILNLLFEKDYR